MALRCRSLRGSDDDRLLKATDSRLPAERRLADSHERSTSDHISNQNGISHGMSTLQFDEAALTGSSLY